MTVRYGRPAEMATARAPDGTLFVMVLPDGPPRVLIGSAHVIWEVAVSGSEHVVQDVADAFGVEPGVVAAEVRDALLYFVQHGLVVAEPSAS